MQGREKVAGRDGPAACLLFLWRSLKAVNESKPKLLAGERSIDVAVDKVLALEYNAAPWRIASAVQGKLKALDPRGLGRNIGIAEQLAVLQAKAGEAERISQPKAPGRPTEPEEQKSYFGCGQRVENEIPAGLKQDRTTIVNARRLIARNSRMPYDTIVLYHQHFRKTLKQRGQSALVSLKPPYKNSPILIPPTEISRIVV